MENKTYKELYPDETYPEREIIHSELNDENIECWKDFIRYAKLTVDVEKRAGKKGMTQQEIGRIKIPIDIFLRGLNDYNGL